MVLYKTGKLSQVSMAQTVYKSENNCADLTQKTFEDSILLGRKYVGISIEMLVYERYNIVY